MQHYFNPMSRGVTTHWMLMELDAEYETVVVDFQAGETRTADYLAMNPMGKVPMLVDDGVVVTEVAAICTYLADKFAGKNMAPHLSLCLPSGSLDFRMIHLVLTVGGTMTAAWPALKP